jgi:hypothetical protein
LEEAIRVIPNVECSVRAYAYAQNKDDPTGQMIQSEKLYASDYIKIEFRINYLNLDKSEREGYVHSCNYPFLKKHAWSIMLCDAATKEKTFYFTTKMRIKEHKGKTKKNVEDDFVEFDGSIYSIFS